jgi:hypothetical protein
MDDEDEDVEVETESRIWRQARLQTIGPGLTVSTFAMAPGADALVINHRWGGAICHLQLEHSGSYSLSI